MRWCCNVCLSTLRKQKRCTKTHVVLTRESTSWLACHICGTASLHPRCSCYSGHRSYSTWSTPVITKISDIYSKLTHNAHTSKCTFQHTLTHRWLKFAVGMYLTSLSDGLQWTESDDLGSHTPQLLPTQQIWYTTTLVYNMKR